MPDDLADIEKRLLNRLNNNTERSDEDEEIFESITIKSTLKIMAWISIIVLLWIALCR